MSKKKSKTSAALAVAAPSVDNSAARLSALPYSTESCLGTSSLAVAVKRGSKSTTNDLTFAARVLAALATLTTRRQSAHSAADIWRVSQDEQGRFLPYRRVFVALHQLAASGLVRSRKGNGSTLWALTEEGVRNVTTT